MPNIRLSISTVLILIALVLPASTPAQTPEALDDADRQTIFEIAIGEHAPPPVFVGLAQVTFPPGASIIGGTIAGLRIFLIESGSFEFVADSPVAIRPENDATREQIIAAGESGTAQTGDLVIVTGNPPFTVSNLEDSPSGLLDIVIWPPVRQQIRPFVTEQGVIFEPLVIGTVESIPEAPVRLQLQHQTIPREGELSFDQERGPTLMYVESGRLGIRANAGDIVYASAAANAPGTITGRVRTLSPGREAILTAGGSLVLQTGASGLLSNAGRTPIALLLLSLEQGS